MPDELDDAWRRGDLRTAYALSAARVAPLAKDDHPYRAEVMPIEQAQLWHDHGRRCWQLARFVEADNALQRAYSTRRQILGDEHPDTIDSLEALAALASYQLEHALAIERYTAVLDALARTVGSDSVRTAVARRNYATALRARGEYVLAERALDGALRVLEAELPEEDPQHVDALKAQAYLLCARGQARDALAVAERAIELGRECWDLDHPFVAAAQLTAASAERELRRYRPARKRLATVIPCFERAYGDHPLTSIAIHELARVELEEYNHDVAEELARRALAIYRAFYPQDAIRFGTTLIEILATRGQLADAVALGREIEAVSPEEERYRVPLLLADVRYAQHRLGEALEDLRRARTLAPTAHRAELDAQILAWGDELLG